MRRNLVHDAGLAVTVSVLLGVKLVHKTRLLSRRRGGVVVAVRVAASLVAASSGQARCSCAASGKATAVVVGGVVEVTVLVVFRASVTVLAIADVTEATSGATANVLGDTLELVVALLATAQDSTLGLELVHGHGGQSSSLVVGCSVVVDLMNGNSSVDNVGLDDLLVDNRLNSLVNVVVDVLSANGRCYTLALGGTFYTALIPELSLLLNKVPLGRVVVTVVKLAVLYATKLGSMCLGKHVTVLNGLNSAVVVILVDLLVDSSVDLLVLVGLYSLVYNSWCNSLVNCGVMVTRLVGEVRKCCLDLVHFDVCR